MTTTRLARYKKTLFALSDADIALLASYVKAGWGARGIQFNTQFTLKQINAVFALVAGK